MSNEPVETVQDASEITEEELAELTGLPGGEQPSFHPLLMVWREVLRPARDEKDKPVQPGFASRIVNNYREITFGQMVEYRDRYFAKVIQLLDMLEDEIATDGDCLSYDSAEDDREFNGHHYKNLLLTWQMAIVQWEKDWDSSDEHAGVELAAISEVHRMFFDQTGLVSFLDNIKFQFDEADQAALAEALQELKESK